MENQEIKPGDVLLFKVGVSGFHPFGEESRLVIGVAVSEVNQEDQLGKYGGSFYFLHPSEIHISKDKKTWWPQSYCYIRDTQYIARENYVQYNFGQITASSVQGMLKGLKSNLALRDEE